MIWNNTLKPSTEMIYPSSVWWLKAVGLGQNEKLRSVTNL